MKNTMKIGSAVLMIVFGFAVSQSHGEMMEKEKGMMKEESMMESKMTAMLTGAKDHHASGTVEIAKDKMGKSVLVLTDLNVDKVPDGRVYLAKDGDYTKGVELGKLKQFSGKVEFAIAAGVNPGDYNSVVIWCKKFSVEIGRASFGTAMMEKGGMMDEKKGMMEKEEGMMKK